MNELGQAELEQIIIQTPTADGVVEGSLWSFYESIGAGGIEISDDGYIWTDGTLIPTNGEPYMDVSPNDLYVLMEQYIIQDIALPANCVTENGVTNCFPPDDIGDNTDGLGENQNNNSPLIKLAAIGLLIYVIVNVK